MARTKGSEEGLCQVYGTEHGPSPSASQKSSPAAELGFGHLLIPPEKMAPRSKWSPVLLVLVEPQRWSSNQWAGDQGEMVQKLPSPSLQNVDFPGSRDSRSRRWGSLRGRHVPAGRLRGKGVLLVTQDTAQMPLTCLLLHLSGLLVLTCQLGNPFRNSLFFSR